MDFAAFKQGAKKMEKALSSFKDQKPSFIDDRFYKTTPDAQGNADVLMRILPQPDITKSPIILRYYHSFKENGRNFYADCPTSIGKPCPADEYSQPLWEKFNDTKKDVDKNIASRYSRKKQYICNVLIINDTNKPENNGKVFLYRFGNQVYAKIQDKIEPKSKLDKSVIVFHLFEGMNFKLKQRLVSNEVNYTFSEFDNETGICPVAKTDAELEKIFNQLHNLDEFTDAKLYKPYEELKKKFMSVVGPKAQKFFNSISTSSASTGTEHKVKEEVSADELPEDINDDAIYGNASKAEEVEEAQAPAIDKMVEETKDEIDDMDFDMDDSEFNFDED